VAIRSHPAWALNEEVELIIDLGVAQPIAGYQRTVLHVITHADGRLRWMYPQGRLASVLHFHNASGLRSKALAMGVHMAAAAGLERWVRSGSITVHHRAPLKIDALLNGAGHTHRAFFLGTPGAQRKIGVVLEREGRAVAFAKVATNKETLALLSVERNAIRAMQDMQLGELTLPQLIDQREQAILVQTSVAAPDQWRSPVFTEAHARAVVGMAKGSVLTGTLVGMRLNARYRHRVFQLMRMPLAGAQRRVLDLLKRGASTFGVDGIHAAPAHGDLTPWNTYCTPNGLAAYDWEMFNVEAPALYDVVHFHMQQGIIVDRVDFLTIRERILHACTGPTLQAFITEHRLNVDACIRNYLLEAVSRFLVVYASQPVLSTTQQRQLFAWESALNAVLPRSKPVSTHRAGLLEDLALRLRARPHAFLKYRWNSLAELPVGSDLDLLVEQGTAEDIIAFAGQHPLVRRVRTVRRSFMSTLELFFHDEGYLSLDLIHRFQRKHLRLLDAAEVLEKAAPGPSGLVVPAFEHDLAYTFLFHQVNGSRIPLKYRALFDARTPAEWEQALTYLAARCDLWFTGKEAFWNADPANYKHGLRISLSNRMRPTTRLAERLRYALDTLRGMTSGRGFIVTFSGVDGAGKSTVIAQVKKELEGTFRREVVLMRHRPGLLPMLNAWRLGAAKAEEIATRTLPRKGTNKGAVSSLLRFAYYFLDYAIGQWVVYFRHVLRGRIVLYDRYYFDFMADPRRSNIHLSRKLTTALYAFVLSPKLNFFLYADSATILRRKQELSAVDVEQLTQRYRSLFDRLAERAGRGRYRSIRNEDLATTLSGIRSALANAA
jgi:thymidylate kinase